MVSLKSLTTTTTTTGGSAAAAAAAGGNGGSATTLGIISNSSRSVSGNGEILVLHEEDVEGHGEQRHQQHKDSPPNKNGSSNGNGNYATTKM